MRESRSSASVGALAGDRQGYRPGDQAGGGVALPADQALQQTLANARAAQHGPLGVHAASNEQ